MKPKILFSLVTCYFIIFQVSRVQAGCGGPYFNSSIKSKTGTYDSLFRNDGDSGFMYISIGNHCPDMDHFQWYRNDTLIAGATLNQYRTAKSGYYKVEYLYSGSKLSHTFHLLQYISASITTAFIEEKPILVFPNPANTVLNISFNNQLENIKIKLFDPQGKELELNPIDQSNQQIKFDVSMLEKGIYLLRYEDPRQIIFRRVSIY